MTSLVKQFVVTIYLEGDAAKRLRLNDDVPLVAEELLREKFPEATVGVVEAEGRWYDQHGDIVPSDLVLLPNKNDLTEAEVAAAVGLDWWVVYHPDMQKVIVASAAQLAQVEVPYDEEPLSAGIGGADYEDLRFGKIHDELKKWSAEDSFYYR